MTAQRRAYLSIPAAAAILGIPRSTAYAAVRDSGHLYGVVPVPYRNSVRFSRIQIERAARGEQEQPPKVMPWDVATR